MIKRLIPKMFSSGTTLRREHSRFCGIRADRRMQKIRRQILRELTVKIRHEYSLQGDPSTGHE